MNENGSEVTEQNSKSVSSEDEWNETSTDEESEHNSLSSENEEKRVDLSEDMGITENDDVRYDIFHTAIHEFLTKYL